MDYFHLQAFEPDFTYFSKNILDILQHDDREGEDSFGSPIRGRGGIRGRGRGLGFRGRGSFFSLRGRVFRGSFRGRGTFRGVGRGRGNVVVILAQKFLCTVCVCGGGQHGRQKRGDRAARTAPIICKVKHGRWAPLLPQYFVKHGSWTPCPPQVIKKKMSGDWDWNCLLVTFRKISGGQPFAKHL